MLVNYLHQGVLRSVMFVGVCVCVFTQLRAYFLSRPTQVKSRPSLKSNYIKLSFYVLSVICMVSVPIHAVIT